MEARQQTWKKASRTQGANNCVELTYGKVAQVRDSKNPDGPALAIDVGPLLVAAKSGQLDR